MINIVQEHKVETVIKNRLRPLIESIRGATAVEYALLAGIIALGIVASLGDVGRAVGAFYTYVTEQTNSAIQSSTNPDQNSNG